MGGTGVRARQAVALGLATVLAASVPALGASAPAFAYRQVAVGYTSPGGVSGGSSSRAFTTAGPAVTSTARTGEDRVTIVATDPNKRDVALAVDVTRPGNSVAHRTLACNSLALAVKPGTKIAVTPLVGLCANRAEATSRSGSIKLTFRRVLPPPPKAKPKAAPAVPKGAPPSMRYAVLIGIRDYAGSTKSTVGGVGDVNVIRKALLGAGWSSRNIKVVTDRGATATGIRNAMSWLAARSTPRTFSLLHYSGHVCIVTRGSCPPGHTYLWSHDNQFIPETEVVSRMKRVKGYQWLDVAGCEAGAFNAGYSSSTRLFTGSSRADETSYEEPRWGQSVWTGMAWDRGFNQGMADQYGRKMKATIRQLAAYGARETAGYTRNQEAGVQHPVMAGGGTSWSLYAPPGG